MSLRHARVQRAPGARPPIPLILFTLCACAAPERAPLTPEEVSLAVEERELSAEALSALVERAGLAPFALVPLLEPGEAPDLDAAPFWRACALAYSPEVRAARRAHAAARERADSAGRPDGIWTTLEVQDLSDLDEQGRLMATVDVLGLLGIGRAATARELADAETRAARARLEIAAWDAVVEVDRARAALAAVRAERAALEELAAELETDARRTEVLARHGRVARGALASMELSRHMLEHRLSALNVREADARAALATAAGLPVDAPQLDAVGPATLARMAAEAERGGRPTRADLLARDPRLRAALVEYAVAEARLLDEAAARWPTFRLGPHLLWRPDEVLLGLVAGTRAPWPGALEGRVRAAHEEREAAREAAEDLLLVEEARAVAADARRQEQLEALEHHAGPAAAEAAALLNAAGMRYAVDPRALEARAHALDRRVASLRTLEATRLALVEASLALRRVTGPPVDREETQ